MIFEVLFYIILWVTVNQWKPAALYLDHDEMAFPESMCNIVHGIFYIRNPARNKCFWFFVAVTIPAAKNISPNEHLISVQNISVSARIGILKIINQSLCLSIIPIYYQSRNRGSVVLILQNFN
jgi:hypothetical protein